jgi:hypothetical protein
MRYAREQAAVILYSQPITNFAWSIVFSIANQSQILHGQLYAVRLGVAGGATNHVE